MWTPNTKIKFLSSLAQDFIEDREYLKHGHEFI